MAVTDEQRNGNFDFSRTHPKKLFDIAKAEGRPLYACAPMVRYGKLAFRETVKEYGVDLCWTPMILAKEFNRSQNARHSDFTTSPTDDPVIVQFGASSPQELGRATGMIAPYVSGIDLNCGCPQSWACAESLGAALMNKRELVHDMVRAAITNLENSGLRSARSVSVKIRVHKDLRETLDFVNTVIPAGVDFITVHGRTRHTPSSHPVNLDAIKLVREHVPSHIPVLANGDVFTLADAHRITAETGVQGVMAARGLLSNPALFAGYETCPWEAVEKFMSHVVKKPIPFKLVLHHLGEMTCGVETGDGTVTCLLGKKERSQMTGLRNMLDLIDWLDARPGKQLRRIEDH